MRFGNRLSYSTRLLHGHPTAGVFAAVLGVRAYLRGLTPSPQRNGLWTGIYIVIAFRRLESSSGFLTPLSLDGRGGGGEGEKGNSL
jgi:hypothetical protein